MLMISSKTVVSTAKVEEEGEEEAVLTVVPTGGMVVSTGGVVVSTGVVDGGAVVTKPSVEGSTK